MVFIVYVFYICIIFNTVYKQSIYTKNKLFSVLSIFFWDNNI